VQVAEDMSLLDDDLPLPLPVQLDPRQQRNARMAALNPDDGITL
jgi:type IV secretion system protein VirD4